jgi:adenosylmethionine-8-amino-7-oxononanoate aminotransferase
LLHPYAVPGREDFVTIVRGDGALVWDDQGTEYVDALASLWYCNVGHGRREIIDAVHRQMQQLATFHTFERFANEPSEELAALVAERSPIPDARVFLTNAGSEALDTAMKLARLVQVRRGRPDKSVIVSRERAYHGVNYGGLSAQGLAANKEGWGPLLAAERYQVEPDLLTFAKGVTSGYLPLGGVVLGRRVLEPLEADDAFVLRHGYTYSGHPTCCAAGVANLAVMESEDLLSRAAVVGARLEAGLRSLEADGLVAGVRGTGAIFAVRPGQGRTPTELRDDLMGRGVLARPLADAVGFCPPLVITDAQVDRIVDGLAACLG